MNKSEQIIEVAGCPSITKMEEQQAFQYIKNFLIPIYVRNWEQLTPKSYGRFTAEELRRNIVRTPHMSFLVNRPDLPHISYKSRNVEFIIKRLNGKIVVAYSHPLGYSSWYNIDAAPETLTPKVPILKEDDDDKKNLLTKQEEQEALQFIRKFLIDQSLESLIKKSGGGWDITRRDISMNLKKILDKSPISNYDDLIFYTSKVHSSKHPSNFTIITFRIAKMNNGKVLVSWRHFYDEGPWYIVSRGFVRPKSYEVLPENVENKISKEDEQRALQAIRIYMVPRAVELYNQRAEKENLPKADINVVRQNLKKKRENYKGIAYHSEVDKDTTFVFTIIKADSFGRKPKQIMVHCINPIGCMMGMYIDDPSTLNENIESGESGISKMDEQRAVQYIRYRLIPFFVDNVYNKFLKLYSGHYTNDPKYFPAIGYQTFRNNLKKYASRENFIVYHCKITDRLFITFYISENEYGQLIVSYHHTLPVVDKKNNTFIQVQADPPTELKESKEEVGPGSISKIEEGEALQFIKKKIIPNAVAEINKYTASRRKSIKFSLSQLTTEEDISRNIRKTKHEKGHLQDYIEYTSFQIGSPHVVFFITKAPVADQDKYGEIHHLGLRLLVGYKPIFKDSYSNSQFIMENIQSSSDLDLVITKEEEHNAEQIIIKHLIPSLVRMVNWLVKQDKETGWDKTSWDGKKLEPITDREVVLGMKKIKREPNFILFKFEKGATEEYFAIRKIKQFKDDSDDMVVKFSVGYRAGKGDHVWDEKKNVWVDDLSRGWSWKEFDKSTGK